MLSRVGSPLTTPNKAGRADHDTKMWFFQIFVAQLNLKTTINMMMRWEASPAAVHCFCSRIHHSGCARSHGMARDRVEVGQHRMILKSTGDSPSEALRRVCESRWSSDSRLPNFRPPVTMLGPSLFETFQYRRAAVALTVMVECCCATVLLCCCAT